MALHPLPTGPRVEFDQHGAFGGSQSKAKPPSAFPTDRLLVFEQALRVVPATVSSSSRERGAKEVRHG
jgi:hypothetical protein